MDLITNEFVAHRTFHLIVERFNTYVSSVLVLFLITCGVCQIVSASILVQQTKLDLNISLPLNIIFVVIVFETTLVIMGVFGFPGKFYQNSKSALDFLKRKVLLEITTSRKRKYCTHFFESCQVLKIRFGLSNFIEKTTPPIFQLFCADRIIDVLLTQQK